MLKEIIFGAGGIALITAIIAAIRAFMNQKGMEKVESIYVDELNIGEAKKWFADKITKETLKGMILYPTPENIAKWKLNIDPSQDSNILIQAVYDESSDKIIAYREVIFGTLSSKFKELLDSNNGVLVIEK